MALGIGSMVFAVLAPVVVQAADPPTVQSLSETTTKLQISIDTTWVLLSGFLVFFMQTGFAMLEAGLLRQRSVVNALLENFIDAAVTILAWWAIGFGIAFGTSAGGLFGIDTFFLSQLLAADGSYPLGAPGSTAAINRLLAEVGKRVKVKGKRFGIFPFPNKDESLFPQECKKHFCKRSNTYTLFFFQFAFAATASTSRSVQYVIDN
ncbi:ammonium transporter [Nostoc linckia NIES-25]|nr:ammonium transporter [Nostoc linckia NIES-25]